jgi:DNA polymerase III alpha subunit
MTDIDIDFLDRMQALNVLKHVKASRVVNNEIVPHNTGVYLQSIPFDPITNLAGIDYKLAEERGYFKIDFLNVNVYKGVRDEIHLKQLMDIEPLWDLLEQDDFVNLLFQVNGHGPILRRLKPTSVGELAAVLAIIRPAKRHLMSEEWDIILDQVWQKPDNGDYYFKSSHAHAYAMAIVVQMNLICEQIS